MLGNHTSIDMGQATPYAQEMRKWESTHTKFGPPGRPYVYAEFPRAMYRCKYVIGKGIVKDEMHTVQNDDELQNMASRGFHPSLALAARAIEREHTEHGKLAAERDFEIRHGRLSAGAAAEVRAVEEEIGSRHVPGIPAMRKSKGWPKGKPRGKRVAQERAEEALTP